MKHIIWDFNGTLLNDTQLSLDVDNNVFEKLGIPCITLDDYRNNMTMPVRDFYPAVGVDYSVHSYETIARLWLDEFNQKAVGVGLVSGALDAIRFFTVREEASLCCPRPMSRRSENSAKHWD